MAKRFELHLEGMDVPAGLIHADRLVDIVKSLQEMATRLGRIETDSASRGRPSKSLERVASLRIGMEKGSTTIVAERDVAQDALKLDLPDEAALDRRFSELIEGIGTDRRPAWVTDSLASSADDLVVALQRTAPTVELRIDGVRKRVFDTHTISRETWRIHSSTHATSEITFVGRLYAVNLHSHRLHVQDDVGNQVALPHVANDSEVGKLVGEYVTVTGRPDTDPSGTMTRISDAVVEPAPDPVGRKQSLIRTSLDELLASVPGPVPGGIADLTDDEVEAFLEAIG